MLGGGISYLAAYEKTKKKYGIVNEEAEMVESLEGFVQDFVGGYYFSFDFLNCH